MNRRRWMRVLAAAAISFAVTGTARAQDASAADKEKALELLESSKKGVLAATKGLSEAQWNFKPAPDTLKPTNRFGSPEAAIKHFVESRAKTEEFLKTTADLRGHAVDSPAGGKWDAYQFILMIAAHSQRHTKQIEEVKSSTGYPAK